MSAVLGKWMLIMLGVNVLITIALTLFITRRLGQPILAIKRALREIGSGNLDVRLRSSDKNEFGEISAALTAAMHSVRTQISAAKRSMDQVDALKGQPSSISQTNDVDTALDSCRSALDFFETNQTVPDFSLIDDDNNASKVA